MMRIITGSARGTKLLAPQGLNTRPTSERAKQGVFNILQFDISGKTVLDLFAGSGQMGLEALSRGAAKAVFSDYDADAIKVIESNVKKTHMENKSHVMQGDYKTVLRSLEGKDKFDLIFLDPPYRSEYLTSALTLLRKYHLIARDAYIILESETAETAPEGFALFKSASYGKNHFTILKKEEQL